MATDFHECYAKLIERHVGRRPRRQDGLSEPTTRRREKELGVRFPQSLRIYYRMAGNLPQLNKMHNIVYGLTDVRIEDGYLILMEENQGVVHWGFRLTDLDESDPKVWQRVNGDPPQWYSE